MKVLINGQEYVPASPRTDNPPMLHKLFYNARKTSCDPLKKVAAETGLGISTICNAESGNSVSLLTAIKLCRYYGIDLELLADSIDKHGIPNAVPRDRK